jgi:hypothetical protein
MSLIAAIFTKSAVDGAEPSATLMPVFSPSPYAAA